MGQEFKSLLVKRVLKVITFFPQEFNLARQFGNGFVFFLQNFLLLRLNYRYDFLFCIHTPFKRGL